MGRRYSISRITSGLIAKITVDADECGKRREYTPHAWYACPEVLNDRLENLN
jgi:hypothetical protein